MGSSQHYASDTPGRACAISLHARRASPKRMSGTKPKSRYVLIAASRQKEQAEIQRQTSEILLEKAKIDAEAVRVAADAEAYKKAKILSADNALAQKLEAEIEIQKVWAEAYSSRKVPQYVFGGSGSGEHGATPVGADGEVKQFMQLMTIDAARRLNYDRGLEEQPPALPAN